MREKIVRAKDYTDTESIAGEWTGEAEFRAIERAVDARARAPPTCYPAEASPAPSEATHNGSVVTPPDATHSGAVATPPEWRSNPEPAQVHDAPKLPANGKLLAPAGVTGKDVGTPTPLPKAKPKALASDVSAAPDSRVLLPAVK
jgi:hypothetical protein